MTTRKLCLLAALALAAVPAAAAYRCVDEKGRTHFGDTPPPACADVVMYEVTRSGKVLRTIQPTMSETQWKAKQEAEEKAKLAEKAAAEQTRKDTALLSTYANEKELDTARERNIEPLKARIALSQERMKEIDKRVKVVKEEMEFYTDGKKKKAGKDDTTAAMGKELERLDDEKKTLQKNIVGFEKEISELRVKYDVDKRRWLALKQGSSAKQADVASSDAQPEPAKADAKPVKADAKPVKADAKPK
jgi:chromosome segregation ATPase